MPQAAKTSFKQIAWGKEEWKDASHKTSKLLWEKNVTKVLLSLLL